MKSTTEMKLTNGSGAARGGFTLVELLVVIAIIGVMVGLLLPAVQAARESARRMQCSNHLKQMALGAHNHQSTYGYLPGGGRDGHPKFNWDCCDSKVSHGFSWMYNLLPFVEQQALWELGPANDPETNVTHPTNTTNAIAGTLPSIYNCPSKRPPFQRNGFYRADYAGNAGQRSVAGASGANNGFRGAVRQTDSESWKLTIEQIKDGSSNTIIYSEKAVNSKAYGSDGGDNERWNNAGWDDCIYRSGAIKIGTGDALIEDGLTPIPDHHAPYADNGWKFDPSVKYGERFGQWHQFFGSSHPAGLNVAMADGSVRFVAFNVDSLTFRRAALVDDGEAGSLP